ncbi:MAG: STAS domain-containing protein [Kiritimatiellaeota bacterium]|nr:STAS domain-containing protein [Kiritimatiellota bacterium]
MDRENTRVVTVPERLDSASVDALKVEIQAALDEAVGIVLDFSRTRFVDSVGLGTLVNLLKSASQRETPLALAGLTPQVRQIFELTRLYRLFDIFETVEQARGAI